MKEKLKKIAAKLQEYSKSVLQKISGEKIQGSVEPPISRDMKFGLIIIVIFFGLFWLWAVMAPLETAALASGKIVASTNRKTIQHLEGGIVRKLYVHEGSEVKAGDPLIKLDDTHVRTKHEILSSQSIELYAKKARLIAQRDNLAEIQFPEILMDKRQLPDVESAMAAEQAIFEHDKKSFADNMAILKKRVGQLEDQIDGLKSQLAANEKQYGFIEKEIGAMKSLDEKSYIEKPRLWALEREAAKLHGKRGELLASIAERHQKISETEQQMVTLRNQTREEILDDLAHTNHTLSTTVGNLKTHQDILKRTLIVAPQNGKVVNLKEHTLGGVIGPGEEVMDIVPSDDALVVAARISPLDIDIVHKGMMAKVKLIAYKQRSMPAVDGVVTAVSADSFYDSQTNTSYYRAQIDISAEQLKKLEGVRLYPGMPVEVMVIVDRRTTWQYLIAPIKESYNKAFREQ